MSTPQMTVDEALLLADGLGLPGHTITAAATKGALDVLAAEVRRQHANEQRLQAQVATMRAAIKRQVDNIDRWLKTLAPADPVESRSIYEQLRAAVGSDA